MTPATLQDALQRLHEQPQAILAGGTDFYPALQDRQAPPDVIDVMQIPELRGIRALPGNDGLIESEARHAHAATITHGWRIGAGTTWSDLLRADLPAGFDGLKAAAREVGSIQIQNVATLAGNLCTASPAADGVPALLTLEAVVEIASIAGRRQLPLNEFLLGPRCTALCAGEMLTAILVPAIAPQATGGFAKLGSRRYLVISIAMVAMILELDEQGGMATARVAVGACSPVARRLASLEAALEALPLAGCSSARERHRLIASAVSPEHLHCLAPIDDIRAPAGYRLKAVVELLQRLACELGGSHPGTCQRRAAR